MNLRIGDSWRERPGRVEALDMADREDDPGVGGGVDRLIGLRERPAIGFSRERARRLSETAARCRGAAGRDSDGHGIDLADEVAGGEDGAVGAAGGDFFSPRAVGVDRRRELDAQGDDARSGHGASRDARPR